MASFHLTIVTPVGAHYDGEAEFLVAPGKEGSLGILAHHAPIIACLQSGVMSVTDSDGVSWFAVGPGVLEVSMGDGVTVLVDRAWPADSKSAAKEFVAAEYRDDD